jgi:regulator of replication initiation timing
MNLLGKIFIVLIFVMSLVFSTMVVAVYSTHTNWREVVMRPADQVGPGKELGLRYQLENERQLVKQLQERMELLTKQLNAEKLAYQQAVAKLETENARLADELDQLKRTHAQLVEENNRALASLAALQEETASLRAEVVGGVIGGQKVLGLREEIRLVQKDRDSQFQRVVELTDELNQTRQQLDTLKEQSTRLAQELANAQSVLRKFGLKPVPELYADTPPEVEGVILATTAGGHVEISIGSDDGLEKGQKLEVYRIAPDQAMYLGRIEVLETAPDRAVCRIIPEYRKGEMQRGDRVASKILN